MLSGHLVIIPAIVYYELKREPLRANKAFSVARLEAFASTTHPVATFHFQTKRFD